MIVTVPISSEPAGTRALSRGLAWNIAGTLFEAAVSMGAMLALVRLIAPSEYGRFAATLGLLGVVNAFGAAMFISQALQLPAGEEPDWSAHLAYGGRIQLVVVVIGQALAATLWWLPSYRPLAPTVHLASAALILDAPAWISTTMLRRALDFKRLRVINGLGAAGSALLTLALWKKGALALVAGSCIPPLAPAVDLWLVRRWRPRAGWWRIAGWEAYRPSLRFGLRQGAATLLLNGRAAAAAGVLPRTLGFFPMGLLNRAAGLFQMTTGRAAAVLTETIYPLLPTDGARFARRASLFVQAMTWSLLPAICYLGFDGAVLVRLVYGPRWAEIEPLLLPASLTAVGVLLFTLGSAVLLAANRLRACFWLDLLAALAAIAALFASHSTVTYAWALGAGQLVAGGAALLLASPLLEPGWAWRALLPPLGALALGGAALHAGAPLAASLPIAARVAAGSALYALACLLVIRGLFAAPLARLVAELPGSVRWRRWLWLPRTG
jgi:O-antigen/teichoic acid export membrane protein